MRDFQTFNILGEMTAALPQVPPTANTPIELDGVWHCDDGGLYYIRQIGPDILWYGEATGDGPFFANVASGRIDGAQVRMTWADVPKGAGHACGGLVLDVVADGRMAAIRKTGGFGGSIWTR